MIHENPKCEKTTYLAIREAKYQIFLINNKIKPTKKEVPFGYLNAMKMMKANSLQYTSNSGKMSKSNSSRVLSNVKSSSRNATSPVASSAHEPSVTEIEQPK